MLPSLRFGFGEMLDDLAFWLVVGIVLAGGVTVLLPSDLLGLGLGGGILPVILALIVSVPIYMCASASTPIAAALMAKGLSPGAALVFLLAGPATNVATILLLNQAFGRRFVKIYLASVVAGALASGLTLDFLISELQMDAIIPGSSEPGLIAIASGVVLALLLLRSLYRGAWSHGIAELRSSWAQLSPKSAVGRRRPSLGVILALVVVLGYLGTGIRVVPENSMGYGFTFGALTKEGAPPGLHYHPPAPFGSWDLRRVDYPRKTDIGFRTDLRVLATREGLDRTTARDWHSPLAAMNPKPEQATFVTSDNNLVELAFSVHYGLSTPFTFLYELSHEHDIVNLYAESVARELIVSKTLDQLLTSQRSQLEEKIAAELQVHLDRNEIGVEVRSVHFVDVHPPTEAVGAFRDVSSALEERATRVHRAHLRAARSVPLARGEATKLLAQAEAESNARSREADARLESFTPMSKAFAMAPQILENLLSTEASERMLSGRRKIVIDSSRDFGSITFWDPQLVAPPTGSRRGTFLDSQLDSAPPARRDITPPPPIDHH